MSIRHRQPGFSLIEVMIAILILGVALVGLTQGIVTALGSTKDSETQTTAALMAAGQIEQLRADGALTDGVTDGKAAEGLEHYRWKQTLSPTAIEGLHEVSVEVDNAGTGAAIYELRTLLFDPPADSTTNSPADRASSGRSRSQRGGQR